MSDVKCSTCGSGIDVAKGNDVGHCADCNEVTEVKKEASEKNLKAPGEQKKEQGSGLQEGGTDDVQEVL